MRSVPSEIDLQFDNQKVRKLQYQQLQLMWTDRNRLRNLQLGVFP